MAFKLNFVEDIFPFNLLTESLFQNCFPEDGGKALATASTFPSKDYKAFRRIQFSKMDSVCMAAVVKKDNSVGLLVLSKESISPSEILVIDPARGTKRLQNSLLSQT